MATLQKIRSKGPLLVIVIGLALFAFIAGDAWKVLQPHQGAQSAGIIDGDKISAQDYQKLVDEYSEVIKFTNGLSALNDDQLTQVKDQVWQNLVNSKLIKKETNKLGLTVTKEELEDVINKGTNPMLLQTPFRNQQTGAFDKDMLKKFLAEYAKMDVKKMPAQYSEYYQKLYNLWTFIEKQLAENLLEQKYQNFVAKSLISNPVEAKQNFDERTIQMDLQLAAIPYSSIPDASIKVSDSDLKTLYDKKKEQFKQLVESRDIKYIDVQVKANAADRKALQQEITEYTNQLANTNTDIAAFVRSTSSTVPYSEVPESKTAYPSDIAARLDSTVIGQVYGPYFNESDNTFNSFKTISKASIADSIQFRQIQVTADGEAKIKTLADSIYNALNKGADFVTIAKKYGQAGDSNWMTSKNYEGSDLTGDNAKYINTLNGMGVNEIKNLTIGQANVIIQVLNKKNMVEKYNVAVIKRINEFSKDTYNKAYNDFSQFIASNPTLKDMQANAERKGYRLLDHQDLYSNEHNVCGIHSTREAMKWIFASKKGDVSSLYECGDNDHLLVISTTGINEKGYAPIEKVKTILQAEIIKDKKAEKLMGQITQIKSIATAKSVANVQTDTIKHVTFAAPVFVGMTRASEPALAGAAAKTAVNTLSKPVKGNAAVYVFQIYNKLKTNEKFDEKTEENTISQMSLRAASRFIADLYQKAKIEDTRYLFF